MPDARLQRTREAYPGEWDFLQKAIDDISASNDAYDRRWVEDLKSQQARLEQSDEHGYGAGV